VVFFAAFSVYPVLSGLYLSFTDFTLLRSPEWVGLQNYRDLAQDRLFWKSLRVTLVFVAGSTIPVWVLSLLAAILFSQRFRGREFLKALFFVPVLPSLVVVAVIWRVLLHPSGVVTAVTRPFVGGPAEMNWLSSIDLAPLSMIIVHNWSIIPFYMLIWLAGLMNIPNELREAARIDGARNVQVFWSIDLPLLRPTAVLVAAISSINAFQGFILQYVLSPGYGGPADSTTTLGLLIWKYGFQYFRMGHAAAISVILFAIIMVVTLVQLRVGHSSAMSNERA
jgi:multiple sugar transport system permease protein